MKTQLPLFEPRYVVHAMLVDNVNDLPPCGRKLRPAAPGYPGDAFTGNVERLTCRGCIRLATAI